VPFNALLTMNDTNNHMLTENLLKRKEMRYMSIIEWLENITPFEDDNGFDLFVPLKKVEK
jgi:hypothetical protein